LPTFDKGPGLGPALGWAPFRLPGAGGWKNSAYPLPCGSSSKGITFIHLECSIWRIEAWGRQRQEETGRPPLGREEVCRQDPHHEPNRIKKAPAPLVHAVAPEVRRALRKAYFRFLTAYQHAARLFRAGMREVEFPAGAFPPALPVRFAARSG